MALSVGEADRTLVQQAAVLGMRKQTSATWEPEPQPGRSVKVTTVAGTNTPAALLYRLDCKSLPALCGKGVGRSWLMGRSRARSRIRATALTASPAGCGSR